MKKKNKKILQNNKGVTGIDLVISIIVLVFFTGIVTGLMYNLYKTSLEIQKSANAMAYATIILEKVDEKAYEDVTNDFIANIGSEVTLDTDTYQFTFNVSPIEELENDIIKKVNLEIRYTVGGEVRTATVSKLKIKEISK